MYVLEKEKEIDWSNSDNTVMSFGLECLLDQHSMSQFNGQMSIVSV